MRSYPARPLTSWEVIFVERGQLQTSEDNRLFTMQAGESLLLCPGYRYVGEGAFSATIKFFLATFNWLKRVGETGLHPAHLDIPHYTRVSDPQYVILLFRQFLSEQENIHRS